MAGYVMTVGGEIRNLKKMFDKGTYGTLLSPVSSSNWHFTKVAVFADFFGMKAGDYIFFFAERNLYGVGRLVNLEIDGETKDCKFLNYPESDMPITQEGIDENLFLDSDINNIDNKERHPRMICTFEPYPAFFEEGVDMDEVLLSNSNCFKMLRAMEWVSFIKLDDSESQCLLDVLIKRLTKNHSRLETNYRDNHKIISEKLNAEYLCNPKNILRLASDKKNSSKINQEYAIEADLFFQLTNSDKFSETREIFGNWDYVSRQVVASPFKPVRWLDKMDIFAYEYFRVKDDIKIRDTHCVIEIKRGTAKEEDILQTLKYVDWLKNEYTGQDYSSIKAFLIAFKFSEKVKEIGKKVAKRTYLVGSNPIRSMEWSDFKLITYNYNSNTGQLEFRDVTD